MRTIIAVLGLPGALTAVTLVGCGGSPDTANAPQPPRVTVTQTTGPSQAASSAPPQTHSPAPAGKIRVPNVVGHNHQAAQNEMQAVGLYMLAEQDVTGQGRMLILDRNWIVVRQKPKAGTKVTPETTITLFSKKIGE